MEFLVKVETNLPTEISVDERARLMNEEAVRGSELKSGGVLKRIWRIPGRFANWSVYETSDATELHDVLASLPLHPWQTVTVHPLATHPLERD